VFLIQIKIPTCDWSKDNMQFFLQISAGCLLLIAKRPCGVVEVIDTSSAPSLFTCGTNKHVETGNIYIYTYIYTAPCSNNVPARTLFSSKHSSEAEGTAQAAQKNRRKRPRAFEAHGGESPSESEKRQDGESVTF